jgi:hypothetical protein
LLDGKHVLHGEIRAQFGTMPHATIAGAMIGHGVALAI